MEPEVSVHLIRHWKDEYLWWYAHCPVVMYDPQNATQRYMMCWAETHDWERRIFDVFWKLLQRFHFSSHDYIIVISSSWSTRNPYEYNSSANQLEFLGLSHQSIYIISKKNAFCRIILRCGQLLHDIAHNRTVIMWTTVLSLTRPVEIM